MPVPVSFLSKVANVYQNQGDFSINGDFTWWVSDCEELVLELLMHLHTLLIGKKIEISRVSSNCKSLCRITLAYKWVNQ